ncbi:MAG TPA: hypothetical protein VG370_18940 [Chloroflexota bacterium]|nr:hypothetical protein [Chloroflexota bacterium]
MHENAGADLRAFHRESVAYALHTWRTAEETLCHPFLGAERPAHERAVAAVLAELGGLGSVTDLIGYYAAERLALHAAVFAACADSDDDPRLLAAVVEGAAFWRRLRELVAEAVA